MSLASDLRIIWRYWRSGNYGTIRDWLKFWHVTQDALNDANPRDGWYSSNADSRMK